MKTTITVLLAIAVLAGCTNNGKEKKSESPTDKYIALHTDTVNVVKLSDTLVIYESTCRGCAYEGSTSFDIKDSLDIVKLQSIITTDNNSPDMNGGSISKDIVLVPLKPGKTTFKFFKFWEGQKKEQDSSKFTLYTVEVKN